MKYLALKTVLAFGKDLQVGEYVELTTAQAASLNEEGAIAPYKVKVERPPKETKTKKKQSRSARPGRVSRKKTAKKSGKTAK